MLRRELTLKYNIMKSKILVILLSAVLAFSACGTTQETQQTGQDTSGTSVGTGSGTNNTSGTGTGTGTTDTSTIKADTTTTKTDTTRK